MGRLNAQLSCHWVDMIDDLESGGPTIAYHLVGRYASGWPTRYPVIRMSNLRIPPSPCYVLR